MGVTTLLMGSSFFISLFIIFKNTLKCIFPVKLSNADHYFIAEKCVNSVQAILATVVGIIIAHACGDNIMSDTHWLTNTYAWFALPYFMYDIWAMYNTHFYLNEDRMLKMSVLNKVIHFTRMNKAMLVHHLILPIFFFPSILGAQHGVYLYNIVNNGSHYKTAWYFRNNKGDYFVGILYTCEAAIPFISLRFILSQLKMKDNVLYVISGLLMIFVFFLARVCIFLFLYWKYSTYAGLSFLQVPFKIPIKCNIGCLSILLIQFYFLFLMIRGAARAFYKMYKRGKQK